MINHNEIIIDDDNDECWWIGEKEREREREWEQNFKGLI